MARKYVAQVSNVNLSPDKVGRIKDGVIVEGGSFTINLSHEQFMEIAPQIANLHKSCLGGRAFDTVAFTAHLSGVGMSRKTKMVISTNR